jgi:predicted nucleic acid-binding protein
MSADSEPSFVDTNIFVHAFERTRTARQEIAQRLLTRLIDEERLCLSTQVLQELFVTLTRKVQRPCSVDEALSHLSHLAEWPLFQVDWPAIREAVLLSGRARISFWDSLLVVSAARSGAARLYTEDMNHGQEIFGVTIVNPFAASGSEPCKKKSSRIR